MKTEGEYFMKDIFDIKKRENYNTKIKIKQNDQTKNSETNILNIRPINSLTLSVLTALLSTSRADKSIPPMAWEVT